MLNVSNFTPTIFAHKAMTFQELVRDYCGQFNSLVVWCVLFLLGHYFFALFFKPFLDSEIDKFPFEKQLLFKKGLDGILGFLNTGSLFIIVYFLFLAYYQGLLRFQHYVLMGIFVGVIVGCWLSERKRARNA